MRLFKKIQKFVEICVSLFGVPKHAALKKLVKITYFLQETFIKFSEPKFYTVQTKILKTYPADCRKIAAVDSNKHDWDWTNRIYWKKKIFIQKYFLSPIYFDGIS